MFAKRLAAVLFLVGAVVGCNAKAEPVKATPDVTAVAAGDNEFALDFYRQIGAEKPGNLFLSPWSIATALDMTYAGRRAKPRSKWGACCMYRLTMPSFIRRSIG